MKSALLRFNYSLVHNNEGNRHAHELASSVIQGHLDLHGNPGVVVLDGETEIINGVLSLIQGAPRFRHEVAGFRNRTTQWVVDPQGPNSGLHGRVELVTVTG